MFLRSMAARGLGGALSRHVGIVASLLEEVGLAPVLVETAGAGQGDTGVKAWVDCLLLILTPESGDIVQMLKAGLMEWADIYVVNKADRDGADRFASQLRGLVASQRATHPLSPAERVHLVQANSGGADDLALLVEAVEQVAKHNARPRHELWERVISEFLTHAVVDEYRRRLTDSDDWSTAVSRCARGEVTAADISAQFLSGFLASAEQS
ncbi:MAG: hypothetical protein ACRDL8_20715 [Solirubrobacteraceae bacterium]